MKPLLELEKALRAAAELRRPRRAKAPAAKRATTAPQRELLWPLDLLSPAAGLAPLARCRVSRGDPRDLGAGEFAAANEAKASVSVGVPSSTTQAATSGPTDVRSGNIAMMKAENQLLI
mmetsp:Transcript_1616/g.2989  ORF Transcript_1616/g.2989 Transcript_1616/m.2989 type:complete len:119 (+) Transcript_1616:123-479(+)